MGVVIRRRVSLRGLESRTAYSALQLGQVGGPSYSFRIIVVTVEAKVLVGAVGRIITKGIGYLDRVQWHPAPNGRIIYLRRGGRCGQTVFIKTPAIFQYIFRNIT